ncbi:MAG: glutamate formimidoyltransferase [Acidobacteriota bacterium]|jgi:glutamate formiminotransferase/formiminotetrahydrofolate cyclodeaminase|nr:glutamate formimidoyltransferase [Acidobacteriota bacterium]
MRVVESVPNISEGRRPEIYEAVARAVATTPGVTLLNVDPGAETNRTVITFVGAPEAVLEGAWRLLVESLARIDMRTQHGAHPRIGAVDVVPFVPVGGVTMEECAELARRLGERAGRELGLPIYLYEAAASRPERRNLATIRAGEYEGLEAKLADPAWKPDFGPAVFKPEAGATVIGARNFLVAYNVNLNTLDKRLANRVAFDIREKGRRKLDAAGRPVRDANGEEVWEPGLLPGVKAVGWTIPEFGCAQVSINITDLEKTPLHVVFDTCVERATARGMRVTGSELVGLVPRSVLLDAGRHYLRRMERSAGVSEAQLVETAVRTLGLHEVKPFDVRERVIEYRLAPPAPLAAMTLTGFADELASESPAPGGGSVAAYTGALGAGLAAMVASLSHPKQELAAHAARFEEIGIRAHALKAQLLAAVDADTASFDRLLAAMRMPQGDEAQKRAREEALRTATIGAIEVPLGVLEACPEIVELCREAAAIGLATARSDAGTGIQMARAAAGGAYQNVCINARDLDDPEARGALLARAETAWQRVRELHAAAEAEVIGMLRQGL